MSIRFERLTTAVVIDKLILRRKYWVAYAVCQYLKLPGSEGSSKILAHWACYKVTCVKYLVCAVLPARTRLGGITIVLCGTGYVLS